MRRSMTGGALLTEGDDNIALDRDLIWCDAVAFEQLLDGGREEEALALYRGELLEGFHLSGCLEFERWLEDERRRLERRAAHGYPEAASNLADSTLKWFEGRPSDWTPNPGQSFVYAKLLNQVGRWVEAQAVLEEVGKAVPFPSPQQNNVTMELTYALASQGERDQAFRTVSVTSYSNLPIVRAWIEAALGERERAMELLRESGFEIEIHGGRLGFLESMREYPPFVEEFMRSNE